MTTYTSQPDETTGLDCFIESANPTTNRNTGVIFIGEASTGANTSRGLIKFDLSTIPVGVVILSATLTLTVAVDVSSNARTFRVYRQKKAWTETGATWNKYDGTNNWTTAGGFDAADCEQTDIGSCSYSASETAGTAKNYSLSTLAISEMVNGLFTNNGFLVKADTETDDAYDHYSSADGTASRRPKLVIEYERPGGIPVAATPYLMV